MTIRIETYTPSQQDYDFYGMMGPFFACREYAKEMGGWQFYNDTNTTWFVALDVSGVVGFCSAIEKKTHIYWDNFYVVPSDRGKGISTMLHRARLQWCSGKGECRAITDNPIQAHNYIKIGMVETGKRGRYTKYTLAEELNQ